MVIFFLVSTTSYVYLRVFTKFNLQMLRPSSPLINALLNLFLWINTSTCRREFCGWMTDMSSWAEKEMQWGATRLLTIFWNLLTSRLFCTKSLVRIYLCFDKICNNSKMEIWEGVLSSWMTRLYLGKEELVVAWLIFVMGLGKMTLEA